MPIVIQCPACHKQLRVPDHLLGQKVRCPSCRETFVGEAPAEQAPVEPLVVEEQPRPAPPRERPRQPAQDFEGEPGPVPRRTAPPPADEDREEFEARPPRRRAVNEEEEDEEQERAGPLSLSNNYRIDIGQWFELAKDNYGAVLGPMIGYTLILMVIGWGANIVGLLIPIVGPLISLFIQPPLQAGYTVVCLAQIQGKRWSFGDFFGGFRWYGQLLAIFLLRILIGGVCMVPSILVFIILAVAGMMMKSPGVLLLGIAFAFLNFLAAIYVCVRTMCFNVPLIIERGLGPIEAIQASWTVSRGHFWGLFGSYLLFIILGWIGILGCGIGLLFTWPLFHLGTTAGYILIAGKRGPRRRRRVSYQAEDEGDY
jgi:predicted Zn finger-like uncharacterized protein